MLIDKRLNTEKISKKLIDYIVHKIVSGINPEKIILFGSYATHAYTKNSDLDLFVIKDDTKKTSRIIRREIDSLLRGRKFPIDLIVRRSSEVKRNLNSNNTFYTNHIFGKGKVLYEKASSRR